MLCKVNELKGYGLDSLNGKIGETKEFYFDDRNWTDILLAQIVNMVANAQRTSAPVLMLQ